MRTRKQAINELKVQKEQVEKEKDDVFLKFQQLNEEKKKADRTIESLKNDISNKEKENNAKISELIRKVADVLKEREDERAEALQDIQALNDAVEEKEKNRQELELKLHELEMNSKANTESMNLIRVELEQQVMQKTLHILELLGHDLNHQLEWIALHESQLADEDVRQKLIKDRIAMLKQNYFIGEDTPVKLEETVNAYLDDAMLHFREEVGLSSEKDYRRVCYMFAGMSGQAIGEIMNESKDSVYQRRSRLLKRMLSFSCVHKEMFTLLLSKQLKNK